MNIIRNIYYFDVWYTNGTVKFTNCFKITEYYIRNSKMNSRIERAWLFQNNDL
jgi:hypothetical protein